MTSDDWGPDGLTPPPWVSEGRRISDLTRYAYDKLAAQGKLDDVVAEAVARVELTALLRDADTTCRLAVGSGPGKCLAEPPGIVLGDPVRCDRLAGHTDKLKHRNHETGFSWWGER